MTAARKRALPPFLTRVVFMRPEGNSTFLPGAVLFKVHQMNHHCHYKAAKNNLEQVKQEVTHKRSSFGRALTGNSYPNSGSFSSRPAAPFLTTPKPAHARKSGRSLSPRGGAYGAGSRG